MEIKIEIWKNTGKWYTTETQYVDSLEDVDVLMNSFNKFKGMLATVYYWTGNIENHYQPYRMYKL